MAKLHSTPAMLVICGSITLAIIAAIRLTGTDTTTTHATTRASAATQAAASLLVGTPARADETRPSSLPDWAASATGRIETVTGEHRLTTLQPRRIAEVIVETHDQAKSGDILVRLDDEDLFDKYDGAFAEVQVRLRERAEENVTGLAKERQDAEDSLADAERALFAAQQAYDEANIARRAGEGSENDETAARNRLTAAEKEVKEQRQAYNKVAAKSGMPKPTRLDSGLTQARSDLALIETEIGKTRIRAPFDGDVLNVWAKIGEVATPAKPLVLFGDKSTMRVRAELEERDVTNVRVGQKVIVRTDAYPGKDFSGKVTSMGGALGSRNIASRGPRRPSDIDVLEVIADLGAQPDLLPGMRVDVFFVNDATAKSAAATANAQ